MKQYFWFMKASWFYLGCDHGTGRWKARRIYLLGFISASFRFIRSGWSAKLIREGNRVEREERMIHESHSLANRSDIPGKVCVRCYACECCCPVGMSRPCEKPARHDTPLFKEELPVYYQHGSTVTGHAEGVRKPNNDVVITITLLHGEAGEQILAMLQGHVPLALSWALRVMEVKRVPKEDDLQAPQD